MVVFNRPLAKSLGLDAEVLDREESRGLCGKRQYKRERPIRADYVHSPERKPS